MEMNDYLNNQLNSESEDVLEISAPDLFAQLLYKWKWMFLLMIIGALAAFGLWSYASKRTEVKMVTQEDIDLARENLSEEDAQQAEYLFAQYVSYLEYRKSVQEYLSDSLYSPNDFAGNIALSAICYVNSTISNVNQIFTSLALGTEEYEKIADIMKKDKTMLDDIYRRVSISDITSFDTQRNDYNYILENTLDKEQRQMLLQIYIVAESREQADAVMDVVRDAFNRKLEELKVIDPEITVENLGETYSSDTSKFLRTRQNNAVSSLDTINNQINALQTNYIDKLDKDVMDYYQLMKDKRTHEISPPKKPSLLKYLVIGIGLGLVLSLFWIVMRYVLDRTVKTARELAYVYHLETPNRIFQRMSGFHLFGGLARICTGADLSGEAVQVAMAASDIGIKLAKQGKKSVYLIVEGTTEWQKQLSAELVERIKSRNNLVEIRTGNPLSGPDELEAFSGSDAVVIITELKVTHRYELKKWISLCRRYEIPVAGTVAMEAC